MVGREPGRGVSKFASEDGAVRMSKQIFEALVKSGCAKPRSCGSWLGRFRPEVPFE